MKFSEMPYQRITYEEIAERYRELTEQLRDAADGGACMEVLRSRNRLMDDMTPMTLCYVRHDMDVNDAFYAAEQDYYDEIGPRLADLGQQFDRVLLESPHRAYLEGELGRQAFVLMEQSQRGFDSRLIPLSQESNALESRHTQLTAGATVQWEGQQVKRSRMGPFAESPDRETRKRASLAISDSWEAQRGELEELYDKLVHNRHRKAQTMGFADYTRMSYHTMCRVGYGPAEVGNFRQHVKKHIVPLQVELAERRRRRLGLDKLRYYDNSVYFPEGNPVPMGDTAACLEATREMYTRLSPETGEFIAFMLENELCDVEIRDGKRGGGYMTSFEKYHAPFIFANFDGTSENAYIMCHEGGHAFQGYLNRHEPIREKCMYTSESAETHAMAMEFFTGPHMELFFGERAEDYRIKHLENAIRLIAAQCQQDEFQQLVYEQPDMSPEMRNTLWRRLQTEYFPTLDYSGNENLERGCGWQRIPHMYQCPFYAIDYALAQVCALEYDRWAREDRDAAWQSYLTFCRQTGTDCFPALVRRAGLEDPFAEETLRGLAERLRERMATVG